MDTLKTRYVSVLRRLRRVADRLGVLELLETRRDTRALLYLRSLFSIHDAEDMVRLDIPWWTFAAAAWVDQFLCARPGALTFEYGAGASTVWLARRCARVHSVEHDPRWAETVSRFIASYTNVTLAVVPPEPLRAADLRYQSRKAGWRNLSFERYVRSIEAVSGRFNLIVVDGRCRQACLEAAVPRLADGGVVVFDNTLRRRYRGAIAASGLRARVFTGLAPGLPYPEQTTVLGGPSGDAAAGTLDSPAAPRTEKVCAAGKPAATGRRLPRPWSRGYTPPAMPRNAAAQTDIAPAPRPGPAGVPVGVRVHPCRAR